MRLIIVDCDSIVGAPPDASTAHPSEWQPFEGCAQAIARLNHAGFRVAAFADHSPASTAGCDTATLLAAHRRMIERIEQAGGRLDAVFFGPSAGEDAEATTRAIRGAFDRLGVTPAEGAFVGGSCRRIEAAEAAGCRPILLLSGADRGALESGALPPAAVVRVDLTAVAAELAG